MKLLLSDRERDVLRGALFELRGRDLSTVKLFTDDHGAVLPYAGEAGVRLTHQAFQRIADVEALLSKLAGDQQ